MAINFIAGGFTPGFTGYFLVAPDTGTLVPMALPASVVSFSDSENIAYQDLIDNSALLHNKNLGVHMGNIQVSGPVQIDRGLDILINIGFDGTRGSTDTGGLVPWVTTLKPNVSTDTQTSAGVWYSDLVISGQFGVGGEASRLSYQLTAMVLDPDNNVASVGALPAPEGLGSIGLGTSMFLGVTFANGDNSAASGYVEYDGVTSFTIRLTNGLIVQKSAYPGKESYRIAAGCAASTLKGTVNLTQLKGATNVLPSTTNGTNYPLSIKILSGSNNSDYLTLDLAVSYDARSTDARATDFNTIPVSYSLFGTNSGNSTGSSGSPINAIYTHA